jgi:hypothetical protein
MVFKVTVKNKDRVVPHPSPLVHPQYRNFLQEEK